jgi:general stress protein 26
MTEQDPRMTGAGNPTTADPDEVRKVAELVDQARTCMFTTMTDDGRHVSRPMAVQDVEFDGDLWFFTLDDTAKVQQLRTHPEVNVAFADEKNASWTSLSGRAELVHDRAKAEELWSKPLEVWFSDGLETPGLALVKVHADTAEYWDAADSKVRRLIGAARAVATGDPDKFPAEQKTVRLD